MRVIARIDIKGPNLVKGVHMEGLRVLGDPSSFSKYYYEEGIDEIAYIDVVASLYGRNSLFQFIEIMSQKIFVPITVGGGIRTLEDIEAVLRSGADKVYINTAAIKSPEFISIAADKYGSSTIVVGLEISKSLSNGKYYCFTNNGREETGNEALKWAQKAARLGAGEIFVTFIDYEGTGKGIDLDFVNELLNRLSIPVVVSGGFGKKEHFKSVSNLQNLSGIALASILHYNALDSIIENNSHDYDNNLEGNKSFIDSKNSFINFDKLSISNIKSMFHPKFGDFKL
jgi:imidazole glycerol-phosphate synthase subunit HisF